MSAPRLIAGLSEVASRYDALFCDVWGVVHNGRESFPAACEALLRFKAAGKLVLLLSNAPRPSTAVYGQLRQLGVPDAAWSGFVTSGDATRRELTARAPGPAWAVGPARDAALYEGLGLDFAETPHEAAFVSCTGPFDDDEDTPEDYRERFEACVARGLEMVCANPDRVVRRGDKMIYCAGALADLYTAMGGVVIMAGKPYPPIYACAYEAVAGLAGREVARERLLMIGDGPATDVKGANAEGIDCLFVAEGIESEAVMGGGMLDAERVGAFLGAQGLHTTYALPSLRW